MTLSTGSFGPTAKCVTSGIAAISFATKGVRFAASPDSPAISPKRSGFRKSCRKLKNGSRNAIDIDSNSIYKHYGGNQHYDDWKQAQGNSRREEPFAGRHRTANRFASLLHLPRRKWTHGAGHRNTREAGSSPGHSSLPAFL